ncbi:MAG: galactokinase [Chitinophagaceae bacterium]|nr:galactokinase [Chitinophagaceae bacterium]
MDKMAEEIKEIFISKYGNDPGLYFSPGRINLIGEHIDYNDGFVMPCAIDKGIFFAIAENGSDRIRFFSKDYNEEYETQLTDIHAAGSWKNYVLGVVDEFQKAGEEIKGFDCAFSGNLPVGAGLSSSAALEGGLAFGLNEIFDLGLSRKELAFLCQKAEHGFPGVKCGIMDQYANMLGQENKAILLDCRDIDHTYIPLETEGYSLVLINSCVHHSLASSAYNTRRNESEGGLKVLQRSGRYNSYRDVKDPADLREFEKEMGKVVFKRATFIVGEIQRTIKAASYLKERRLEAFGKLMFGSHDGLSSLYEVSCEELDFLVNLARINPDIAGSRMMGGGFGGCTINLVKSSALDDFVEASIDAYKKKFDIEAKAYRVSTGNGTSRIG